MADCKNCSFMKARVNKKSITYYCPETKNIGVKLWEKHHHCLRFRMSFGAELWKPLLWFVNNNLYIDVKYFNRFGTDTNIFAYKKKLEECGFIKKISVGLYKRTSKIPSNLSKLNFFSLHKYRISNMIHWCISCKSNNLFIESNCQSCGGNINHKLTFNNQNNIMMNGREKKLKYRLKELENRGEVIYLSLYPTGTMISPLPINECRINDGRLGKFKQISEPFYDKMVKKYHNKIKRKL